jgi:Mn2+/Fe2+ NRAMP family transporter
MKKISEIMNILGPGLMWAGAAIGVSHLIQSTRAGANYGFALLGVVILANIFKYPFFEFGPRYAASTGHTLLKGYKKLGDWAFYLYLLLTFLTMFTIQAVVTLITTGVISWFIGGAISPLIMSAIIMIFSTAILALGHYSMLDKIVKYIIIFLTAATAVAVIAALTHYSPERMATAAPSIWSVGGITFMVALMGWMPSAIDISVWSSIWTTEKHKENPEATSLKNSLFDFNVGYFGTVFIALGFLSLGALVMFGSGRVFSNSAGAFAGELINLYSETIGSWSKYLVATAALATMFSTTITCLDAYGRVLAKSTSLIKTGSEEDESSYYLWISVVIVGALLLIGAFSSKMKMMVDVATILSFMTAPVLAILNYKVIMSKDVPEYARIPKWLNVLSIVGIVFLVAFAVLFVKVRFL